MKATTRQPYFPYPAMQQLKNNSVVMDSGQLEALKRQVALNSADPRAVALYVDLDGDDWLHIYPAAEEPAPLTTGQVIDTFLETYGHSSPQEDALLERMIFNPVPDYSEVLAANEQKGDSTEGEREQDSQDGLISAFLDNYSGPTMKMVDSEPVEELPMEEPAEYEPQPIKEVVKPQKKVVDHVVAETPRNAEPTSLSESLAQIFIRQGRYERAFEIISALNLKNPEKSVYFADQLRFLQKVIALQQRRADSDSAKK